MGLPERRVGVPQRPVGAALTDVTTTASLEVLIEDAKREAVEVLRQQMRAGTDDAERRLAAVAVLQLKGKD